MNSPQPHCKHRPNRALKGATALFFIAALSLSGLASETVTFVNELGLATNLAAEILNGGSATATNECPAPALLIRTDSAGAIADYGLLHVRFTPNLAESRPVTITTHHGATAAFRPTCIALVKRSTGEAWLVGQTTNSIAEVSPSEVFYRDAFDNISADIGYGYTANGSRLEQFITIRENIALPRELQDCEDDLDLECWTEFFLEHDPVSVQETLIVLRGAQPGLAAVEAADQSTDLGNARIPGRGKAFGVGEEQDAIPVAKTWVNLTSEQETARDDRPRRLVSERTDWLSLKPKLDKLPTGRGHASIERLKSRRSLLARLNRSAAPLGGTSAPVLIARTWLNAKTGVVIDFAVVAPEGLIAWWKAEGDANDSMGTFDGTARGGLGYVAGEVGQGFNLDGVDDYVTVSAAPLNFESGADFSLEGWIKPVLADTTYNVQMIVDKRDTTMYDDGAVGYALYVVNTGSGAQLGCQITDGPLQEYHYHAYGPAGPNMGDGNYHHVTLVVHRGTDGGRLYVDGNVVLTFTPDSGDLSNDQPFLIGKHSRVNAPFKGIIDELSLYNRALSQTEIQSIVSAAADGKGLPPVITSPPVSEIAVVGVTVRFSVSATGTAALAYQWKCNNQAIPGACSSVYTILSAQLSDQGNYSVEVRNPVGTTSADAVLTVIGSAACDAIPFGLVSWWRAEGDAADANGLNPGTLMNGATFGTGEVGQGFSLNGASRYVRVPSSGSLCLNQELSIECWYKDTGAYPNSYYGLVAKRMSSFPYTTSYGINIGCNLVQVYFLDPAYGAGSWKICSYSPVPQPNVFHHIAGTFKQINSSQIELKLYIDGVCANTVTRQGNLASSQNTAPVTIGTSAEAGEYMVGIVDEVAIYNRVLLDAEIQGMYNARAGGKCQDFDGDGLPDVWELRYFGNLLQGATGDFDGDGLSNLQEYQLGTSPVLADTGATGTTDGYRDADGDGLTNLEEYNLGTEPLQPNVAAPVFAPVGGSYSSSRTVTVSCPTVGAAIHYTLNGTEPTETSSLYSAPVLVDRNLTLKAKAWKTGWITSETETEGYRIENPPANQAPTVTFLPPTGASFLASDIMEILVEAEDADGTISKIQLFHGNFKIAEATSSPLRYTLGNLPAGSYTFTAKAIDDDGAVTVSAPAVLTVSASGPTISLVGTQPFFNSSPGTLMASVIGVNPAALTSLTLNGSPVPTRTGQFPLTVSLVEGENTFRLAATDNQNRTAQAATKVYLDSILPVISITAPANNSSFGTTRINVTGTFTEVSLKRITVNGVLAFVSGSSWEALNVPLVEGANTVTATAEDLSGNARSATINVTGLANPVDPVQLTATPVGGFAPLQVTLTPQSAVPGTLQVLYDFNGNNVVDQTAANLDPINHTYSVAGEYFPVVTVVTASGRFSSPGGWNGGSSRLRINVQMPPTTLNSISVIDPVDVKSAANGHLYVLSRSTATIAEYDGSLGFVRSKSAIGTTPMGLDVDADGNVYVALTGENHVAKLKFIPATGTFELDSSFGTAGVIGGAGTGNGQFNSPYDVAVTPSGEEIAVSDSGNHRIQRFRTDSGAFIDSTGDQGSGLGQFSTPKGLAFDSAGYLYIVDSGNNRVVLMLTSAAICTSGSSGAGLGQFQAPVNLGVGARGIYVAETGNNRVQAFDAISSGGGTLTPFAARLSLSAQLGLNCPAAVAPTADLLSENIFVADTGNNRVLKVAMPEPTTPAETWNLVVQQLTAASPNVEAAMSYFSQTTADGYRQEIFTIGTDKVRLDMSAIGVLTPVFIENNAAQYYFEQTIEGQVFLFPVEFVKENGAWKVLEF
jgi:hypothetical protein